jgi:hypothetical protein
LRRHGLLVAWSDLPIVVPELVPDALAARAVKDAERAELELLKAGLRTASYQVAGRRGRPGVGAWDPARVADPVGALARLLGGGVTIGEQPAPAGVPITVRFAAVPSRGRRSTEANTCARCSEPAAADGALCKVCAWLEPARPFRSRATGPPQPAHPFVGGSP